MAHFLLSYLILSLQIECEYDIFNLVTGQEFNALTLPQVRILMH